MEEGMQTMTASNKALQLARIKKGAETKGLQERIRYLEDKVKEVLTKKEEEATQLKSEIINYQNKAKQYKDKMKVQREQYNDHTSALLGQRVADTQQDFMQQIEQLTFQNQALQHDLEKATKTINDKTEGLTELQEQLAAVIKEDNFTIQSLKAELARSDQKNSRKMNKITNVKEDI